MSGTIPAASNRARSFREGVVYAIRARTRAQIESTQIIRSRPRTTRGGQVERARGTGALRSAASGSCATDSVTCAFDGWRACPDYQTDSYGIEAAAAEVRIPECISAPLANAR